VEIILEHGKLGVIASEKKTLVKPWMACEIILGLR